MSVRCSDTPPVWAFETFAEGLDHIDDSGRCCGIAKQTPNSALFDAAGAPLTSAEAAATSTWRSHHSFGGRCGFAAAPGGPTEKKPNGAASQSPSYSEWDVGFRLVATNDDPHLLVSAAPRYFPYAGASSFLPQPTPSGAPESGHSRNDDNDNDSNNDSSSGYISAPSAEEQTIFDCRMIETPLIYEEPYTLSVDCGTNGVWLWSDQWQLHGKKIADKCLQRTGSSDGSRYEGLVKLHWRLAAAGQPAAASFAVSLGQRSSSTGDNNNNTAATTTTGSSDAEAAISWQRVFDMELKLEDALAARAAFAPYVTLMEAGESAFIIQ